jgi:RHS repeat-associated protein
MLKTTFDGLGRRAVTYRTDRSGDPAPGASGNYVAVHDVADHEAVLTGDVVLDETEYGYIDAEGLLDLSTTRRRTHDATDSDTGALSSLATAKVITSYTGADYDDADRVVNSINFGTNQSSGLFEAGGDAPEKNQAGDAWETSAADLETSTVYNERGLIDVSTDPEDRDTKYWYDDMDRRIAVIENHDDQDPVAFVWDVTKERWKVTDGLDPSAPDTNRVTSYAYDGLSRIVMQVAHHPDDPSGELVQATRYDYGVSSTDQDDPSELASEDLLFRVHYPDEDDGEPGGASEPEYLVTYRYNRQGELTYMRDQNETEHNYKRDDLGRVEADYVSDFGTNIDQAIDGIETGFDGLGRVIRVSSYDVYTVSNPDPEEIENEVEFEYTPLWQVETVYQEHTGEVDTGTSYKVAYAYDDSDVDGGNWSRLEAFTYGGGAELIYFYGSGSSSDARISRLHSIDLDDNTAGGPITVLEYDYIGLDMFGIVDLADIDVQLDRSADHDGTRQYDTFTDNPGKYPGLDQFGRVIQHMWVDGDFWIKDPTLPGGDPVADQPWIPEVVAYDYTYDKSSNRKVRDNVTPYLAWKLDDEFVYDELDRLAEDKVGVWNASTETLTRDVNSRLWDLAMLGNWDVISVDGNGNGVYTDSGEEETRTHNEANELVTFDPGGSGALTLTYDAAGNLRERPDGTGEYIYTHDAWNRLVKVEYDDTSSTYDRGAYAYNGLNWRITKNGDVGETPENELTQSRSMFYTADWQLVEELVDDDIGTGTDRRVQYLWGARYIDDIVLRREDRNDDGDFSDSGDIYRYYLSDVQFSPVVIVDETATVIEQVSYTPYGQARHHYRTDLTGDGGTDINDLYVITGNSDPNGFGEGDLNRSGVADSTDESIVWGDITTAGIPAGRLSTESEDNIIGYDGYAFNAETEEYSVRFRSFNPVLGRWLERDPLGARPLVQTAGDDTVKQVPGLPQVGEVDPIRQFDDGSSVYEYVQSKPATNTDFSGLGRGPGRWPRGTIPGCPSRETQAVSSQGWCRDMRRVERKYHCGLRCYRSYGTGSRSGQQCCYERDGSLSSNTSCRGTFDCVGNAEGRKRNGKCNYKLGFLWHVVQSHHDVDVRPWKELGPRRFGEAHCCVIQHGVPSGTTGRSTREDFRNEGGRYIHQACKTLARCLAAVRKGGTFCGTCAGTKTGRN